MVLSPPLGTYTDNPLCHLHQINGGSEGVEISENLATATLDATATFEATGPDEFNVWTDFSIELQQENIPGQPYTDLQIVPSCGQANPSLLPFGVICNFSFGKFFVVVNCAYITTMNYNIFTYT